MHPEIREARADARLGLRDLVGVMDGDVILAAAVDVEVVAEVFLRHRRALDVPAGKSHAPWTRPFHLALLAGRGEFPQGEIGGVFLLSEVDALAAFETGAIQSRQVAIAGLPAGVEIHAVRRAVGVAVLLDVGDELDLLADVVGRAAENGRRLDVQRRHVREKLLGVQRGDLPRGLAGAPRAGLHLVLAGIGVRREMADIGDVHHVLDRIAIPFQHALEHVLEQEGAEVADVLVVVHRRTAGIQADRTRLQRLEGAQACGCSCRRASAVEAWSPVAGQTRVQQKSRLGSPGGFLLMSRSVRPACARDAWHNSPWCFPDDEIPT